MDSRQQNPSRVWRTPVSPVVLTLVVLVLVCLFLFLRYHRPDEPFVDFADTVATERVSAPPVAGGSDRLSFAIATMWSVESTFVMYRQLVTRVAAAVDRREGFVIRASYSALREALDQHQVDVAFMCTGPYVCALPGGQVRLLVEPEFEQGLVYRSVLLVPQANPIMRLEELRGATLAFSDPESFTGCFVPYVEMVQSGLDPNLFLKKIVFTGNHERSVEAVAAGMVDAAAVHSIVWESMKKTRPEVTNRLRESWTSGTFGPPPVVVSADVSPELEAQLRAAFLGLNNDEEGRRILTGLGIRRFISGRPEDYRSAMELYSRFRSSSEGRP